MVALQIFLRESSPRAAFYAPSNTPLLLVVALLAFLFNNYIMIALNIFFLQMVAFYVSFCLCLQPFFYLIVLRKNTDYLPLSCHLNLLDQLLIWKQVVRSILKPAWFCIYCGLLEYLPFK